MPIRHGGNWVGYSDITALHLAIHRMTGLVTFHGPVAPSTQNDYALSQLAALFSLAALRVSWLSHVVRDESTVPIATRASEP